MQRPVSAAPQPPQRGARFWQFAMVLLAAYAQSAGAAWPFDFLFARGATVWWVSIAAQVVLVAQLARCATPRQAFALGAVFATGWLASTFGWLFIAMHTYGGLPAVLAVLAVLLLAAVLGLYYALACAAWRAWARGPWQQVLGFAVLWTLAELARSQWFTGFGWGAIGYAHVQGPLAWLAPWVGVFGVGAVAAGLAAALAVAYTGRKGCTDAQQGGTQTDTPRTAGAWGRAAWGRGWLPLLSLGALVLALPLLPAIQGAQWTQSQGRLSVTLLQGNIPQDEKFQPGSGVPLALQWYAEQLTASTSDLVVAPETAIPLLPQQLPEGYLHALAGHFDRPGPAALVGIPLGSYEEGYTNSVIGLQAEQARPWRYDKHHLVPFGEFIPPWFKWFTAMMNIPLGDFNRGDVAQPPFEVRGQRLGAHICYEDLFGEELAQRFRDPARAPTVFVNLSNIGWFDNSLAIPQHLSIARMRALELQRPFVRATNTGATVVIDHHGQVQAALPVLTRGVLTSSVEGRSGTTPYAWWAARWGLWPLWLLCTVVAGLLLWQRKRLRPL
jgi:apolipoprotein N-acyltransferase